MFGKCSRKSDGFTLAELLLTLIIIGVISAIALPGLRKNVYAKEFETGLKKGYSTLQQSWGLVMLSYRNNVVGKITNPESLMENFRAVLKYQKICDTNIMTQGCGATKTRALNGGVWTSMDQPGFLLLDGSVMTLTLLSKNCQNTSLKTNNVCAQVSLDVNGAKKPNVLGRDIFIFFLTDKEVVPRGAASDIEYNKPEISCDPKVGAGQACTAEALYRAGVLESR